MRLEGREFCHLLEADRTLAFAGAAGVFAAHGQIGQERVEAMDGPAVGALFGVLFAAGGLGRLGFGHGVAGPTVDVEFVVLEQYGGQGFAHVPLDVVGEHAQKDVRAHMGLGAVADGAYVQIVDALHAAEGLLDVPEAFVGAHGVLGAQRALGFAGAYDVEAVEVGLALDGLRVAFEAQKVVFDRESSESDRSGTPD